MPHGPASSHSRNRHVSEGFKAFSFNLHSRINMGDEMQLRKKRLFAADTTSKKMARLPAGQITDDENIKIEGTNSAAVNFVVKKEERKKCPYLDTVNRQLLDFDMEKVCSVTLSNLNVYCCLICGKYFQGRGRSTPAYTHSVAAG